MSDAAFATKPYPAYTTSQLEAVVTEGRAPQLMIDEIARRKAVEAGDYSNSTAGERMRFGRANPNARWNAKSKVWQYD